MVEEILDAQRPGCPPEYFNIPIPDGHRFRTEPGHSELPFVRSRYDMANSGFSPNAPRQQVTGTFTDTAGDICSTFTLILLTDQLGLTNGVMFEYLLSNLYLALLSKLFRKSRRGEGLGGRHFTQEGTVRSSLEGLFVVGGRLTTPEGALQLHFP